MTVIILVINTSDHCLSYLPFPGMMGLSCAPLNLIPSHCTHHLLFESSFHSSPYLHIFLHPSHPLLCALVMFLTLSGFSGYFFLEKMLNSYCFA
ncbi:hypothetical protein DFH28DRAFT_943667 [Melampsora americana]|nr:hypothetical protein DFH28DRAFT_943667 [Melampsora americana]